MLTDTQLAIVLAQVSTKQLTIGESDTKIKVILPSVDKHDQRKAMLLLYHASQPPGIDL